MFKRTKIKVSIFLITSLNALHYFFGAFIYLCPDPESFCVVTMSQRIYIILGLFTMPLKLILYPIDWMAYNLIKIDFLSLILSLFLYWIFIDLMIKCFKLNKVVFFVILSIFASVTIGINIV